MAGHDAGRDFRGSHHIIPRSRGGSDDWRNRYYWRGQHNKKHVAWHILFSNRTPEEAVQEIEKWKKKDGGLDLRYFRTKKGKPHVNKLEAWHILFGNMTPEQAIEWIQREFIRKEWLKKSDFDLYL